MLSEVKVKKVRVGFIKPPINQNYPYREIGKELKNIAALETNLLLLIKISKEMNMPVTSYFLEKSLESLLEIETN
jgi:hypothetical protein